jgi:hypothetical protein
MCVFCRAPWYTLLLNLRVSGDGQDQARPSNFDFFEYGPENEQMLRLTLTEAGINPIIYQIDIANRTLMERYFGADFNQTKFDLRFPFDDTREIRFDIDLNELYAAAYIEQRLRDRNTGRGLISSDSRTSDSIVDELQALEEDEMVEELLTVMIESVRTGNFTKLEILVDAIDARGREAAVLQGRLEEYEYESAERQRGYEEEESNEGELQLHAEVVSEVLQSIMRQLLESPLDDAGDLMVDTGE